MEKQYYGWQKKVDSWVLNNEGLMRDIKREGVNELKDLYPHLKSIPESEFTVNEFSYHADNIVTDSVTLRVEIRA